MSLKTKTIHELRSIAQGFGIPDLFSKDKDQLVQAIILKQDAMVPEPPIHIPKPEYDARLMTKPPSKRSAEDDIRKLLEPHMANGLHLSFPREEEWEMVMGKKTDTGTCRMPLRHVLMCADRLVSQGVKRE
jgi:hypothetical protein